MTRPYKRACHQTNFSKGGFLKKDSFSFFHFFNFSLPFSMGILAYFNCIFLKSERGGGSVGWSLGSWRFIFQHRENEVMC